MTGSYVKPFVGPLAGTEVVSYIDNGSGVGLGATTGQIAGAPAAVGSGTLTARNAGNLNGAGQILGTAGAGVSPAATGADIVLANFVLSANSFDIAGRELDISVAGAFAANGNTKTVKIWVGATTATVGSAIVGGTTIATSGAVTTNGSGFALGASITKYGATGSNTQQSAQLTGVTGAAEAAPSQPQNLTLVESGAINITLTGDAATTATDIVAYLFKLFWNN